MSKFSYNLEETAVSYDRERLGPSRGRYRHYAECRALFALLGRDPGEILEIGCGTGRITAELVKEGYGVVPTDPSGAMLRQFRKKKGLPGQLPGLPKPIKADGTSLPFKDNQFETVIAIRVFWHLPSEKQKKLLSEMARVASKTVILDILSQKNLFNKLLPLPRSYPITLENLFVLYEREGFGSEAVWSFWGPRGVGGLQNLSKGADSGQARMASSIIPLDVRLSLWLNLLPRRGAERLFPLLYQIDTFLSKVFPPRRYLLKLKINRPNG